MCGVVLNGVSVDVSKKQYNGYQDSRIGQPNLEQSLTLKILIVLLTNHRSPRFGLCWPRKVQTNSSCHEVPNQTYEMSLIIRSLKKQPATHPPL